MTAPPCPACGADLHPLQPAANWPDWAVCDNGHRWCLPLPLTLPGLAPPLRPEPSARIRAWLYAITPTPPRRGRSPSRSATDRPFWTR